MTKTTVRVLGRLLVLVLLVGVATPAHAAPIDEKRAQAAKVKAQIDELDVEVEIAAEDYNEAKARYDEVTAAVTKTEKRLGELTARQAELEGNLAVRVNGMYRQGPLGALELLLGATSFEQFAATWDLLQDMNSNDAARVAELKRTRVDVQTAKDELAAQQAVAKTEAATMKSRKDAIEAQLKERQRLLTGIEAEIAEIERQQEEAARRRAAASAPSTDYGNPTTQPKSEVVKIALTKLGSPYKYGAAGPNSFDCSGFTMWCYKQVGVSLPHSSRAQINVGQRVSKANLKAGDLVFFARGGRIHHVGIYIGGGNFIHSPHTGDVVKIASLAARSDYFGACRP
jgi:cell wall-associated NlpC family hydrolase